MRPDEELQSLTDNLRTKTRQRRIGMPNRPFSAKQNTSRRENQIAMFIKVEARPREPYLLLQNFR
jgi:hypothetical protein